MHTITVNDFQKILKQEFSSEVDSEIIDRSYKEVDEQVGDYEFIVHKVWFTFGWIKKTWKAGGIEISHTKNWAVEDENPDSYEASCDGLSTSEIFQYSGPDIINEDGEKLDLTDIVDLLPVKFSEISETVTLI